MSTATAALDATHVGQPSAKAVFVAWEALRLVFNAALLLLVVLVAGSLSSRASFSDLRFWRFLVKCAVGANLCFCAGPVAEGYLSFVGIPRRVSRPVLFVGGLIVSGFLAVAGVVTWDWGDD